MSRLSQSLLILLLASIWSASLIAKEPCGGRFGWGEKQFSVDSSICKTEALEMYKLVSDINFDFARKVEFTPKDIADIYRIERQELDQGRSCPKAGFLIVTNVVVERIDEDNGVFRSTTLCLKRRKGKRFLLNRVEHLTRTGELHAYKYLFERE